MKLISIIVPVYNAEKYLRECIYSVIDQTYRDWELILVDDGSTDGSGEICNDSTINPQIRVYHKQNGGTSSARNMGIEYSTGEFITFLDADDSLEKNALEVLIDNYRWLSPDLVIGDFKLRNADRYLMPTTRILDRADIVDYLHRYLKKPTGYSMFVYCWGKLFKSSIIKDHNIRFDEQLKIFEDAQFNMHYLRYVDTALYITDKIYIYNTSDHPSAEYNIFKEPFGFKAAVDSIAQYLNSSGMLVYGAYISFAIRQMIRYFSLGGDKKLIKELITLIVNDSDIQFGLQYYRNNKGDSWLIPLLMKRKWITPLMWVCKLRAR